MKKETPTIHVIADVLGINSSTVSRALNNSPRVSKKTKEKVLSKAQELGYQPNLLASNLRRSQSKTIGVVVPRISRHFFSTAIAGIEENAYAAGFNVIICQSLESLEREIAIINNLMSSRVDGVLISVTMETKEATHLKNLESGGVPLVFFDRHCNNMTESSKVCIDDEQAAYNAVEHLILNGCEKIAHFTGPKTLEIYRNRLKGYKKALKQHKIKYDRQVVFTSQLMEEDGKTAAEKILEEQKEVDGIFAANDVSAIGAMKFLKKKGIQIPKDIAIVGFSNEPSAKVIEPALTTIDQSAFQIGKIACDLLLDNIKNKDREEKGRTIILNSTLIKRESSQR